MAFSFSNALNSGLPRRAGARPPPPGPPPPPQVGPLQLRPGFGRNHPQSDLDVQQQQQHQQMVQQQLMQMISATGHSMLPPGQLLLGPQQFPPPSILNEMHPLDMPPLLKDAPPLDMGLMAQAPTKPPVNLGDLSGAQSLDGNAHSDYDKDKDDGGYEKRERKRKRDRWGNQSTERDYNSSCEEIERDNQDNSVDSNHGKLGGAESHLSTGGGGERPGGGPMWSNLLQQMGTFPPVMGVNPLGIVEPNMNPLMFGMMPQDGAMMDANIFSAGAQGGAKEIIECKDCILYPPNPNMSTPSTRKRPPGCKTIFVGGLPEKTTEDMVREIFARCGDISSIRLNNMKKFCHVRFVEMSSVDNALYLSGYRIKIGQSMDTMYNGRLHVDFAQARDDQYDWECHLRQLQREQRHREKIEQERSRIPSPPPVPHFNEGEANALVEKLKNESSFMKATSVAVAWLERGECIKRNAHLFFCMVQNTNSHIRRIVSEKELCEEELKHVKEKTKARVTKLQAQFNQIERVFSSALHKKVWDHFTKAQRKNIETWKKQAADVKMKEFQESSVVAGDDEMEVSDSEDEAASPLKKDKKDTADTYKLKEENDSLRCQLEAYKNEIDLIRVDHQQEFQNKEKELRIAQQTLKAMQQQLLESKLELMQRETKVKELEVRLSSQDGAETEQNAPEKSEDREADSSANITCPSTNKILERDAKLIGLISMFLHIHPFGAGVDYIWSFVQKLEPTLKPNEIETLMNRFPSIFLQELVGIGANMERRWQFIGFRPSLDLPAS
ncbi:unnamed protein product [Bemisia tabaci]|uniref:RRM domain-containing protein n=1 Tax=Bemisia tabaci TaxID=7038 RepID=A0A9P0A9E9_BEMTA|nr:PREDICTED: ecto-NOX disulfide-thiol exchanger 2 [Bemisia tabaci]CAH0386848.1 unnamed protein product [Bemisia tabaci]